MSDKSIFIIILFSFIFISILISFILTFIEDISKKRKKETENNEFNRHLENFIKTLQNSKPLDEEFPKIMCLDDYQSNDEEFTIKNEESNNSLVSDLEDNNINEEETHRKKIIIPKIELFNDNE